MRLCYRNTPGACPKGPRLRGVAVAKWNRVHGTVKMIFPTWWLSSMR